MAWNGNSDDFSDFVERHGLTFPQIVDVDGVLFDTFGVPTQPAFALLGADGDIETYLGVMDQTQLAAFIAQASA